MCKSLIRFIYVKGLVVPIIYRRAMSFDVSKTYIGHEYLNIELHRLLFEQLPLR